MEKTNTGLASPEAGMISPEAGMVSEDASVVLTDGKVVRRVRILMTSFVVYTVWEPIDGPSGNHHTITAIGEDEAGRALWYGRLGTRTLPEDISAMKPYSRERSDAFDEFKKAQDQEAYEAIWAAFPEAARGKQRSGEITLNFHEAALP